MPPNKKLKITTLYDNFQQGDLIFGLNSFVKPIHQKLRQDGFHHYYCNSLNGSVVSSVVLETPPSNTLDSSEKKHYQFLLRHKEYLQYPGGKPLPTGSMEPNVSAAFRRACKLLLINRDSGRNYTAHMVLGDIDWNQVTDKTNQGITNSELRAAYRDASLHGKHPNILFYNRRLESTQAPWNEKSNKKVFTEYEHTRTSKRKRCENLDTETDLSPIEPRSQSPKLV